MLDDKGNTAVYLLYAYTRIKSIARKAGYTEEQLVEFVKHTGLNFTHEKEIKLCKVRLLIFPTLARIPIIIIESILFPITEITKIPRSY